MLAAHQNIAVSAEGPGMSFRRGLGKKLGGSVTFLHPADADAVSADDRSARSQAPPRSLSRSGRERRRGHLRSSLLGGFSRKRDADDRADPVDVDADSAPAAVAPPWDGPAAERETAPHGPGDSSRESSRHSCSSRSALSRSSRAMLESLGESPSEHDMAAVAAVRAGEVIEELAADVAAPLDRAAWDAIPQFSRADLDVGKFLGKGSFSDVFAATITTTAAAGGGRGAAAGGARTGSLPGHPSTEEMAALRAEFRGQRPSQAAATGGPAGHPSAEEMAALRTEFQGKRPSQAAATGGPAGHPSAEEMAALRSEFQGRRPGLAKSCGHAAPPSLEEMSASGESAADSMDQEIDAMFGKTDKDTAPSHAPPAEVPGDDLSGGGGGSGGVVGGFTTRPSAVRANCFF